MRDCAAKSADDSMTISAKARIVEAVFFIFSLFSFLGMTFESDDKLDDADLLIETREVEVVPGFDYLPIFHADDANSGKLHRVIRGGYSERIASMLCANKAAGCGLIAFADAVFDDDLYVGKGVAESSEEGLETCGPTQLIPILVHEAVRDAFVSEHLINGLFAPFVPDLFEPAMHHSSAFVFHLFNL
jgi:hypothetical protein